MSLIKIDSTEFEDLVVCAVRYALGRRSYIVNDICDILIKRKNNLSLNCIKNILADIEQQQNNLGLGDFLAQKEWLNLALNLTNILEKQQEQLTIIDNKKGT